MLILVYVVLSAVHLCLSADLTYYVEEGKGPDTFIGDVSADSNVMDNIPLQDYNLIKFSILQQSGDGNFKLFKNTGKLYTARIIDAEIEKKQFIIKMKDQIKNTKMNIQI